MFDDHNRNHVRILYGTKILKLQAMENLWKEILQELVYLCTLYWYYVHMISLRVYVHIYVTVEMFVHNKYLNTGFKFLFVVKRHICVTWTRLYIAEKGNKIYWRFTQPH